MKIMLALIAMLAMFVFSGCNDDEGKYSCSDCVDEPEALAANDASGLGIYKGLVVGSSGTIRVDLNNAGGGLNITLLIDGKEIEMTTGSAYNLGFQGFFYGTMNQTHDVRIGFYVNATGTSMETFDVFIPGHEDVNIQIVKEYSTRLVEVYEGSFRGDDSGTLNMIILRDENGNGEWSAVARSDGDTHLGGFIEDNEFFVTSGIILVTGKIQGDNVEGSWENANGAKGTWKGKRTL